MTSNLPSDLCARTPKSTSTSTSEESTELEQDEGKCVSPASRAGAGADAGARRSPVDSGWRERKNLRPRDEPLTVPRDYIRIKIDPELREVKDLSMFNGNRPYCFNILFQDMVQSGYGMCHYKSDYPWVNAVEAMQHSLISAINRVCAARRKTQGPTASSPFATFMEALYLRGSSREKLTGYRCFIFLNDDTVSIAKEMENQINLNRYDEMCAIGAFSSSGTRGRMSTNFEEYALKHLQPTSAEAMYSLSMIMRYRGSALTDDGLKTKVKIEMDSSMRFRPLDTEGHPLRPEKIFSANEAVRDISVIDEAQCEILNYVRVVAGEPHYCLPDGVSVFKISDEQMPLHIFVRLHLPKYLKDL